jgi:hypothetical protein
MAGYAARIGPSEGTHDELTIGALVIERDGRRLVILAADIAGIDTALVDEISSAADIERSELLLCASHTHSGPIGVTARLHPADDDRSNPALRAEFVAVSAAMIAEAVRQIEPAELLFGSIEARELAANRNAANGPFDPTLSVLAARRGDRELFAVLVHFACHPTVLSAENRLISADFVGPLRHAYGQLFPSATMLYGNGAAGDVSTRFVRRGQDFEEAERIGAGLALASMKALASARPLDGPIAYGRQTVPLPPRLLEQISGETQPAGDSAAERRKRETKAQGAALLRKLIAAGEGAVPATLDLEVWALGELALISVPGELFASLGARIVRAARGLALVVGYANGYVGYLADADAHEQGTYEALASPFAADAGEGVVEAAISLIDRVRTESMVESHRV